MAATNLPVVRSVAPIAAAPAREMRGQDLLTSLSEIERVAKACAASGYYKDVRDATQAVVKMLAGREMGIGPIQALSGIHIVEGKPSASANLIAANVKRSGRYDYRVKRRDNDACVLEWFEAGVSVGMSEFTLDDAARAGLAGRGNWSKYPRAMLFARALTEGVRVYCPDAAAGVIYTPEELAPDLVVTESGDPVAMDAPEPRVERDVTPPRAEPAPGTISEPQRKRLWALTCKRAEALGFEDRDRELILRAVLSHHGIESSKAIPRDAYDTICQDVQTWEAPDAPADADAPGAESDVF